MIWNGDGNIAMEKGEPVLRSCSRCNPSHAHLDSRPRLHMCLLCDASWCRGLFFDEAETAAEFDAHWVSLGMVPGDSTSSRI